MVDMHSRCWCFRFTWAIPHEGGETNTGAALRIARQLVFNEDNGDRSGTADIVVLVTDGKENRGFDAEVEAEALKRAGVAIFAVGVTADIDLVQLQTIASDPDDMHVFTVDGAFPHLV